MAKDKISNGSNVDKDKKNNKKANIHEGHRTRLRKRISRNGIDSLEEHEVLEYLLFHVIPRKDCNPLAHALINEFGSLYNVLSADESSLLKVPEMTQIAAQFLSLFFKIYDVAMLSKSGEKIYLKNTQEIINYVAHQISRDPVEYALVILLDINNKVIRCKKLTDNNHKEVSLSYSQICFIAHEVHADKVIIAHNHPSGGLEPSKTDIEFYQNIQKVIKLFNASLVDSVIVSNEKGISIKEYLTKKQLKIYISDVRTDNSQTDDIRSNLSSLLDNLEDADLDYFRNYDFNYQDCDEYLYELIKEEHQDLLIEDEENDTITSEGSDDSE